MTATYRTAGLADAGVLDRLFRTVFCDTFAELYSEEDLAAFLSGFDANRWRAEIGSDDFVFRIAEVDGQPAGYVKLGPMKLPVEGGAPAVLLEQLYLLKDFRGAGMGKTLMEWAFEEGRRRGAQELYLTVYVDNHRARRLYEQYGFEPVGRYDFMVGKQADEDIIMKKVL